MFPNHHSAVQESDQFTAPYSEGGTVPVIKRHLPFLLTMDSDRLLNRPRDAVTVLDGHEFHTQVYLISETMHFVDHGTVHCEMSDCKLRRLQRTMRTYRHRERYLTRLLSKYQQQQETGGSK